MAVNLSPVGGVAAQFFTNTGAVLTGGKIYTYAAGTTTPAVTYTSSQGTTAWSNPIVLDAAGRVSGSGEIWLTDGINYKFVLKDSNDVLIATYDNISGINSNFVSYTSEQEIVTATAGQTVFNLSISYQPGTNSLSVFVDGVNQYGPGAQYAYTETDSDTVTFVSGLHVGAEVKFTTTQQQGAGAVNASQVTYNPAGAGAVATNVQAKLRQNVSVMDFGAVGDGTTDDTAAIQAAITYVYSFASSSGTTQGPALYFPKGTYLISSVITMGNTGYNWSLSPYFYGDGAGTIIKVNAANTGAFYWLGPNPDVDGAGNRAAGPIIENMTFTGPGSSANANSIALRFYGIQGITLRNTTCTGWFAGESYQNCDIVNRYNASCRYNYHGIISGCSGYALTGQGQLNSFNSYNGLITNNTNFGVIYTGGQAPCFFGVNFVLNNISLIFSPNNAAGATVTAGPSIIGCYFENDLNSTIVLGGGNGIVRDAIIEGGAIIANSAYPAILVSNYANTTGRGFINTSIGLSGSATAIDQSTSAGKIAYQTLDNVAIGSVTPSTGVFTKVNSGTFIKSATAGGSVDILSVGTFANVGSLSITIISTSSGKSTARKYQVIVMGSGTVTGSDISFVTEVYSGGGSPFSLSETQDSPVAGTNKLTINNLDSVTSTYRITYTVEDLTGTLTIL